MDGLLELNAGLLELNVGLLELDIGLLTSVAIRTNQCVMLYAAVSRGIYNIKTKNHSGPKKDFITLFTLSTLLNKKKT